MLTLRQRVLVGFGTVLIIILILVLYFVFISKPQSVDEEIPTVVDNVEISDDSSISIEQYLEKQLEEKTINQPAQDPDELYAKQVAITFVERYSSYSNQNDNGHIEDAVSMSTKKMAQWIETQGLQKSYDYSGVTTEVITADIDDISDTSAVVLLSTRQILETYETQEVIQKDGRVDLTRVGNDWKVSAFYWD